MKSALDGKLGQFGRAALAVALMVGAALGQVPRKHEIEAQVNEKVVTTYEVYKQVQGRWRELERLKVPDLAEAKRRAWRQARRELVENLLLVQAGSKLEKEHGVVKDFINQRVRLKVEELRREAGGEPKLRDYIEQKEKITYEEYLKRIREHELRNLVVARGILKGYRIRLSAIENYYREHPEAFREPTRVRYRQVRLTLPFEATEADRKELSEVARELVKRIRKGADFNTVAKDLADKSEEAKEEPAWKDLPEVAPAMRDALRRLKPGQVSDPVWTVSTVRILKLVERKPGRTVPFPEAQATIRKRLERQDRDRKYLKLMQGLREKSYVWVRKDAQASYLDRRPRLRVP